MTTKPSPMLRFVVELQSADGALVGHKWHADRQ